MLIEEELTGRIRGALIEVHRVLGPGLLESACEMCLCHELTLMGIRFRRQVELPVNYKGVLLNCAYRADLIVEDKVLVELKCCEKLLPIHSQQLLTYLRISGLRVGLLVNFNVPKMIDGIIRIVN